MRKIFRKNGLLMLMFVTSIVVLSSCGSMRVYVNQDATYSRKNPITINQSSDDNSGTLGELQFLLQSNGYKLMSYGAAKKALNLDSQSESGSYHGEITNTTTFNSVYVMDINYSYYYDVFYWAYTSFSATITDLKTGEIIMTANFRGDKSVRSVLSELVQKMNVVIKK
ncbi:hypothetical protein AGMMS49525_05820 [Bacteroidia bacterium]|nr:hypothetical protein AGMMS49525_05820 [Bacteroidia bacterium]